MLAEVHFAVILESVDAFPDDPFGATAADRTLEGEPQILAIPAHKGVSCDTGEWGSALLAKGRLNSPHCGQACRANHPTFLLRQRRGAKEAVPRINQPNGAINPLPHRFHRLCILSSHRISCQCRDDDNDERHTGTTILTPLISAMKKRPTVRPALPLRKVHPAPCGT
jgi:hypothetical protein